LEPVFDVETDQFANTGSGRTQAILSKTQRRFPQEVTYELYAPGGVGLVVAASTDSRNRTIREMKGLVKDFPGAKTSLFAPVLY
jgi:transcriptional/translational regulatory protein YebC/TACO1